jgi:GNAT superfamily N-acetyltransferase
VVGLIVLIEEADHVLVENVAVDPGRQGEGIGRALLAFAEGTGGPTCRRFVSTRMRP